MMNSKKIAKFLRKYRPPLDEVIPLEEAITLHIRHKTIVVVYEDESKKTIIGVCRFNVPHKTIAHILDIAIAPEHRDTGLIYRILLKGLQMYPTVRTLVFEHEPYDSALQYVHVNELISKARGEQNGINKD